MCPDFSSTRARHLRRSRTFSLFAGVRILKTLCTFKPGFFGWQNIVLGLGTCRGPICPPRERCRSFLWSSTQLRSRHVQTLAAPAPKISAATSHQKELSIALGPAPPQASSGLRPFRPSLGALPRGRSLLGRSRGQRRAPRGVVLQRDVLNCQASPCGT